MEFRKLTNSKKGSTTTKSSSSSLPNISTLSSTKDQIYLYHYENHFDVITSVSSRVGKSYWCLECMKGYHAKEKHRCSKVCKCCLTEGCLGITLKAPWRECGTCHRMFTGSDCYVNHCRPNRDGQSVCQKFYKCQKCNKVISRQKRKPLDHMCGENMSWNCEEYVDPNTHRCFMKPIKLNLKMIREKRERRQQRNINEGGGQTNCWTNQQ